MTCGRGFDSRRLHQSKKKGFPEGVALFFRLLEVEVGIESASGTGCYYFPIGK